MIKRLSWASVAILLTLTGCATMYEPKPEIIKLQNGEVVSSTAAVRHVYVLDKNSSYWICAEPPSDAAFSQTESSDIQISLISYGGKGNDAGGESDESTELEMSGRSPGLLIARELLYRLNEFSYNQKLTKEEAIALYRENLAIIKSVSVAMADNTRIRIDDSVSDAENIGVSEKSAAPITPDTAPNKGGTSNADSSGTSNSGNSSNSDSDLGL